MNNTVNMDVNSTSETNIKNMLRVGTILHGTYRIESYLASGGFGNTYIVKNIEFDEIYAIKEFFLSGVCQREENNTTISVSNTENANLFIQQKEKFKKEARRLRNLNNPHIVKVHDLFEENGTAYYVMDYVDGKNLSTRIKARHIPYAESTILNWLGQILDALQTVHAAGMLHLDIKPANIIVDKCNNVKIIDFGASKQQCSTDGVTVNTVICYTNGYAPNEQIAQNYNRCGPWTDFYALGATLFKLLTCVNPPSVTDLMEDNSEDKHIALPMLKVSDATKRLVLWMMEVNRQNRPQSVAEIKDFIERFNKNPMSDNLHDKPQTAKLSNKEETRMNAQSCCVLQDKHNSERMPYEESTKQQSDESDLYSGTDGASYSTLVRIACSIVALLLITIIPRRCSLEGNNSNTESGLDTISQTASQNTSIQYVENVQEEFLGQEVTYTGNVMVYPATNTFYPIGDNGKMVFSDGRIYIGPFKYGRMEGDSATFVYPNGDDYLGSFYDNHFVEGTYTIKSTGEKFIGTFNSKGQPERGVWYDKNGKFLQSL